MIIFEAFYLKHYCWCYYSLDCYSFRFSCSFFNHLVCLKTPSFMPWERLQSFLLFLKCVCVLTQYHLSNIFYKFFIIMKSMSYFHVPSKAFSFVRDSFKAIIITLGMYWLKYLLSFMVFVLKNLLMKLINLKTKKDFSSLLLRQR